MYSSSRQVPCSPHFLIFIITLLCKKNTYIWIFKTCDNISDFISTIIAQENVFKYFICYILHIWFIVHILGTRNLHLTDSVEEPDGK